MFVMSEKGWMRERGGGGNNNDNDGGDCDDNDGNEEASTHLLDPQQYPVDELQKMHLG
jgi:hypothetical protein